MMLVTDSVKTGCTAHSPAMNAEGHSFRTSRNDNAKKAAIHSEREERN